MRILYIGPVRDFSGYAAAARGYINALHYAGADVVVRAIRYDRADSGSEYTPTELEGKLLKKPIENIDVVIQHTTPNELRPVKGKVNVAVVAWETTRIPEYWAKKLNQFSAVITFCDASVECFKNCGVIVPVFKVPHTFDIPNYHLNDVAKMVSPSAPEFLNGKFVFYNISQLSTKKGIDVLLRAYLTEFHGKDKDKVLLILKTYIDMSDRASERDKVRHYVNSIKNALRLPMGGYPEIMLILNTLTDYRIKQIHKAGNCYVCSSRAEGWCIPAFEALAYGNKLVTTSWGGMGEFAFDRQYLTVPEGTRSMIPGTYMVKEDEKENVFRVDHLMEPLVGQHHGDPELYTAKDLVAEPSVSSMMTQMRKAMNTELKSKNPLMEFDYANVGPKMLEVLSKVVLTKETSNV